jgi:hypothetical protein
MERYFIGQKLLKFLSLFKIFFFIIMSFYEVSNRRTVELKEKNDHEISIYAVDVITPENSSITCHFINHFLNITENIFFFF